MTDRNLFDKKVLPNGITLYTKIVDTAYSVVELIVPVGSRNNTKDIIPGTFHFLEHICMDRSQLFPERHAYKQFLGLKSAQTNASTGHDTTNYYFSTPNQHLDELIPGFISSVFEPLFTQDDIDLQRTIISNERQRKERWFPGNTELSQYVSTQWQWDVPVSLEQRIGTDADLGAMTIERLRTAHSHYFNPEIVAVFIGNQPNALLEEKLSSIKTIDRPALTKTWTNQHWVNKDFHVKAFRDITRHQLYFGNFQRHTKPSFDRNTAKFFILSYLLNVVHGPLYQWLREEKGWIYELNFDSGMDWAVTEWSIMIPLNKQEQVDVVRQEFWIRAEQALQDKVAMSHEVTRAIGMQAYAYQTTNSIINSAVDDIETYGRIIPESENLAAIEKCRDQDYILDVYQQLFNPIDIGSFCAIPESTN